MDFEYYQNKVQKVSTFAIDSRWGQGRSAFGGLTAALVLTQIVACFSAQRQSSVQVAHKPVFSDKNVSQSMKFPFVQGVAPEFLHYFDLRITQGSLPASGSKQSSLER